MTESNQARSRAAAALARERIGTDYTGAALGILLPEGHGSAVRMRPGGRWLMRFLFLVIGLAAGLACGFFNLQTGDTLVTAGLLAAASLVLTLAKPSFAWMSATLIGLGVPAVYIWATLTSRDIRFPPSPNIAATLLAFLPAVAACLLALTLRRLVLGPPAPGAHR